MATECRAKNPNTCRVHGDNTISTLQSKADQAAMSGNIVEYMELRQQIDTAHESLDNLHQLLVKEPSHPQVRVEEGAKAWFKAVSGHRNWEDESSETRAEFRKDTESCLSAAAPYMREGEVTEEAVDAAAKRIYTTTFGYEALENADQPDAFDSAFNPINSPYYKNMARTMLEATKYWF